MDCDIRSFGMVARPLEFLSTFPLRAPPLEMRLELQDSFPEEAEKRTSSRVEEGKPGLFMSSGGTLGVPLEWRQVCLGTS